MNEEKTSSADTEVFELPQKEVISEHYELLLLIIGDFTEEQANKIYGDVKEVINAASGEITAENPMGRRNLAYRVNGAHTGTYFAVEFNLQKQKLAAVHEKMRIRKDIARFMIVKKEEMTQEEKDAYEALRETLVNQGKEQKRKEQEEEGTRKPRKEMTAKEEGTTPTENAEQPVEKAETPSKEEINKQIDKILSDDMDV